MIGEEGGDHLYEVNMSQKCVGGIIPIRATMHGWVFCGFCKRAWLRGQLGAETSRCSICQAVSQSARTQGGVQMEGQVNLSSYTGKVGPSGMRSMGFCLPSVATFS